MRKTRPNRGGMGVWVLILLAVTGGFAVYRVGQLYFDQGKIENEVALLGDTAITAYDYDVKGEVLRLLAYYDVQLDRDDVQVDLSPTRDRVTISFAYERKANLIFAQPVFPFSMDVTRESKKAAGIIQNVQDNIESSNAASGRKYKQAIEKSVGQQPAGSNNAAPE